MTNRTKLPKTSERVRHNREKEEEEREEDEGREMKEKKLSQAKWSKLNVSKQVEPTNRVSNCICACVHTRGREGGRTPHTPATSSCFSFLGPLTGLHCSVLCGRPERSTLPSILHIPLPTNAEQRQQKKIWRNKPKPESLPEPEPEPTIREMQLFRYDAPAQ